MEEKMKRIQISYGIGYGTHTTDIEVEEDASEDDIGLMVQDVVMERVWWSYEAIEDDEEEEE